MEMTEINGRFFISGSPSSVQPVCVVLEDGDSSELMHALGVVARARGMTEVARAAGLTREALYKALRPNSQPRLGG
jgi:probable addiction module antidote protein